VDVPTCLWWLDVEWDSLAGSGHYPHDPRPTRATERAGRVVTVRLHPFGGELAHRRRIFQLVEQGFDAVELGGVFLPVPLAELALELVGFEVGVPLEQPGTMLGGVLGPGRGVHATCRDRLL